MYFGLHLNSQVTGQAIDISYDFLENQMKYMKKEHRNNEKIEREWLKRNKCQLSSPFIANIKRKALK